MNPDVAFYYPGQYWRDADWIKNLILFFDGIAMLLPEYMSDHGKFDDYPIIASLREHGLFHVVRPEENVGRTETQSLANALVDIIASGRLDHLTERRGRANHSSFGSLSRSRLGYYGDPELAGFVVQELKERGLAGDSEDGVSIPIHRTVRALILVLLAQILRSKGEGMGLVLSPATDQSRLVEALHEIIAKPDYATPSTGDVISFDMAMVGVDLSSVPMDEVLDFRRQNYARHRDYRLSVRQFARELSFIPTEERQLVFEQRQEEINDAARTIRNENIKAWRRPIAFGIGFAGAAWTGFSADPIGAAIAGAGAMFGSLPSQSDEVGVYSYLFSARQSLH